MRVATPFTGVPIGATSGARDPLGVALTRIDPEGDRLVVDLLPWPRQ